MRSERIRLVDRIGLVLLAAVLAGGLAWQGGSWIGRERRERQEREGALRDRQRLEQAEQELRALAAAREALEREGASLHRRIPQTLEIGGLLRSLHARMRERRLTLLLLQPQTAAGEEHYRKIPVRLLFQGGYVETYRFLHDLERLEPLLVPERMTISAPEAARGQCQVDLTLFAIERGRRPAAGAKGGS